MEKIFSAFDVSAAGLRAQRIRMNIIANNIANATTTRTPDGGPFRRQLVVLMGKEAEKADRKGFGVDVVKIVHDMSPFKTVFNPGHPDADDQGYVRYPNVEIPMEMIDMIGASRGYEANVAAVNATKRMTNTALEILRD